MIESDGTTILVGGNELVSIDSPEAVKNETEDLTDAIARALDAAQKGEIAKAKRMAERVARHFDLLDDLRKGIIKEAGADPSAVLSQVGIDVFGDYYLDEMTEFAWSQVVNLEVMKEGLQPESTNDSVPAGDSIPSDKAKVTA